MLGGFAGGQAEFVRVPFADVGPVKVPSHLPDEQVLFLSDIFPTGYMAAENCNIEPGDTVAVWGCGPVGLFCIKSAFLLGAERVIAIDDVEGRVADRPGVRSGDGQFRLQVDLLRWLDDCTAGRGPDACIDAVGLEAHGTSLDAMYDRVKTATYMATDRPTALRMAIMACRKGGTVSIPGVYGGLLDKLPMGAAFAKGLTFKMGQTHVHKYLKPLLGRIERGEIDPSFVITHRYQLTDAVAGLPGVLPKQGRMREGRAQALAARDEPETRQCLMQSCGTSRSLAGCSPPASEYRPYRKRPGFCMPRAFMPCTRK